MGALYVTAMTSPSSSLLQPHPFSTLSSPTLLHHLKPITCTFRMRRPFICAVTEDANKTDTLQIHTLTDVLNQPDQKGDGSSEVWSQFAKRVSGEWDGFGAEFSIEGKPIELPESVVPEAYREWEVKVFDWQTQCPTLAQPKDHILQYKTIQLLPTVGCEADAATRYTVDERKIAGDNMNYAISAFAYQSSGSYVAVWQKKDNLIELEYCLISPHDFESRVRIIQLLNVIDKTKLVLQSIQVFREQWYGPFRNGEQLGGCAIRDSAFASTAPLEASQVTGVWEGSKSVADFGSPNAIFERLIDEKVKKCVRDGAKDTILLPKKMWSTVKEGKDGKKSVSEVGWVLDDGKAITSTCLFSSTANLEEISIALETKAPKDV
ncbi:PREDICTED: uncharacterized protein LOC109335798 isoform X2 [Lupinus angustifolius]|uniref:uncharacterized protein LOC109335798 isoform X2 n=1 Tax=Lupinus angustifolius TaxID=3871 RepID=UPI00092E495B|nr:PREDICTED: uncharacterized protein LOC109335798 isoform X2 [Lupinus angustifolius]